MNQKITIALSKGRILKQTLPLFAKFGIVPVEDPLASRSLIIPSTQGDIQFIIVRASDAPTYVQLGAADLGIVGKDVLMEKDGADVVELLDLNIAKCRISVAGSEGSETLLRSKVKLNVATKYVNIARRYFSSQGLQCELIKLYGSMELAPLTGLSDLIVDLVDTGSTLKANNLKELSVIAQISTRLVANKASFNLKYNKLVPIIEALSKHTKDHIV